jgi:hypothetical protein
MNTLAYLITKAKRRYGNDIKPCGKRTDFKDCMTTEKGVPVLWFNTPDDSTHVVQYFDYKSDLNRETFDVLNHAVVIGLISKDTAMEIQNKITYMWEIEK